jgi:hypothetical protein
MIVSGVDPGPNGTTIRTCLTGHSWAVAGAAVKAAAASSTDNVRIIRPTPGTEVATG